MAHLYFSQDYDKNNVAAIEAYNTILQNKAQFFDVINNKDMYLEEFFEEILGEMYLEENSQFDDVLSKLFFTVVDLDGDDILEVVLIANDSAFNVTEVLHYDNDIVYSYDFELRAMYYIKTDGSYCWTVNAKNSGYRKLKFLGVNYREIELESYEDKYDENGNYLETIYLIDGFPVTKVEDTLLIEKQNEKSDTLLYDFNDANVSSQATFK